MGGKSEAKEAGSKGETARRQASLSGREEEGGESEGVSGRRGSPERRSRFVFRGRCLVPTERRLMEILHV